jgi:hypothetical protein
MHAFSAKYYSCIYVYTCTPAHCTQLLSLYVCMRIHTYILYCSCSYNTITYTYIELQLYVYMYTHKLYCCCTYIYTRVYIRVVLYACVQIILLKLFGLYVYALQLY